MRAYACSEQNGLWVLWSKTRPWTDTAWDWSLMNEGDPPPLLTEAQMKEIQAEAVPGEWPDSIIPTWHAFDLTEVPL